MFFYLISWRSMYIGFCNLITNLDSNFRGETAMSISNSINNFFGLCLCLTFFIACVFVSFPENTSAQSLSVIIEKNDQPGYRTWESEEKNIAIDFPADWQVTGKEGEKGVTLSKSRAGWFRLSLIDLPTGETLEEFSKHLIDISVSKKWDIQFKKDKGTQTIGVSPAVFISIGIKGKTGNT